MLEEKYYSISDIAKLTKLTDRTIRNYIANGSLKGKKIGGQWRFTQKDVYGLFSDVKFEDDMKVKTEKTISSYFNNNISFESNNTCCNIIDIKIDDRELRKEMFAKIKELKTDKDNKEQIYFIDDNGKVKMVIIASFDYVLKVMEIVRRYI